MAVDKTKPIPVTSTKPPGYTFGRPTEYKAEYCQMLIDHRRDGFSFESFGAIVKCHRGTLYDWVDKHPDFADAKRIAHEECLYHWETLGRFGLRSKDFNATVYIFTMKARFNDQYGDKREIKLDLTDSTPKESGEEILKRVKKMLLDE